ncbi:BQ5605_C023g09672 [Microbotryum silenes-dioicae]|uniref:BQ5605_C023g09672 protein n=1 Tax=Microbotryum silenes-dioicae TaxID=796604 RepID=A0A2X0MNW7_9BASI|nr:BQ5605_C023g09672 [Microbotryum silenes-dioicae]
MDDDDVPPTASKLRTKPRGCTSRPLRLAVASTAYNDPDHVILRQEKEDMYMEALCQPRSHMDRQAGQS